MKNDNVSQMRKHADEVRWSYVVPPANTIRVVISQHQANFYVGVETLEEASRGWRHRPGSSICTQGNFMLAMHHAGEYWAKEGGGSHGKEHFAPAAKPSAAIRLLKELQEYLESMPNWHERRTSDLLGWINELATLAEKPPRNRMREALQTIWRGMRDAAIRELTEEVRKRGGA